MIAQKNLFGPGSSYLEEGPFPRKPNTQRAPEGDTKASAGVLLLPKMSLPNLKSYG